MKTVSRGDGSQPTHIKTALLGVALAFALGALSASNAGATPQAEQRPTYRDPPSHVIHNRYIVEFKDTVDDPDLASMRILNGSGGTRHFVYKKALKGFAATVTPQQLRIIEADPEVSYIEKDRTIYIFETELNATWGLDRIDQVDRPLDSQYHYNYTAAGVNAFIIDTGIRADHSEFAGRVLPGFNTVPDSNGVVDPNNTNDCHGHGTHVSGTVGGTVYGVAKGVSLIPVRVLDCAGSGTYSGVIAGVDWVAAHALRPAVANMSLGGGPSNTLNKAVAGAVSQGVTMVVAAGNSKTDACGYSPGSEPTALTIGATDSGDVRAIYSNYGPCLDLFAPGTSVTSSWNTSTTATNTINGTSMAAPHVTGVAALALAANPGASPLAVSVFLKANASVNKVIDAGTNSFNRLIYSLAPGAPAEPSRPTIAVASIIGTVASTGSNWYPVATVKLRDVSTGAGPFGITISGSFDPSGVRSCITDSNGSCALIGNKLSHRVSMSKFTVNNVADSNIVYDPTQNTVTQILIVRP